MKVLRFLFCFGIVAILVAPLSLSLSWGDDVNIVPRTDHLNFWPCKQCHVKFKNTGDPQNSHNHTYKHMEEVKNCLFCHSIENPERLHLRDGTVITFDEGPRLCGQCHGEKYSTWGMGLHGLQNGTWNGSKTRLSCPECHNPHAPQFPKMEAVPVPLGFIKKHKNGEH